MNIVDFFTMGRSLDFSEHDSADHVHVLEHDIDLLFLEVKVLFSCL